MVTATNDFNDSDEVGQGGYGKVYRGNLADGTVVAIKRAHEDSLQGSREFCTEIELLSRLHHRNLVSLIGYCDEEDEQVCVSVFRIKYIYIIEITTQPCTYYARIRNIYL
jgi:serine/threonine protein kinase